MSLYHIKIYDDVYHIGDGFGNFCTLILGRKSCLLFDTLTGYYDLKTYIRTITHLNIIVVNSHGHYDHFGGNYQFTDIYMSKKDYALFDYYKPMLGELNNSNGINISNILNSISQKEHYKNIDPDYIFDLGGVILTVVNLEGHTAGSIGLYYQKRKLLLVGDAISPQMCIFFPESLPLSTLKNTFKAAWNYDFHFMLLSHFPEKYPKSIIKEFEKCFTLIPHSKHYDYSYSLFSCMKGSLYIQEINNSEINQMICIITKTNPI